MTIPTLPLVAPTAAQPLILCAHHDTEVPATREVNYIDLRDPRDPKAGHTAICDDDACYRRELEDITFIGDLNEDEPTTPIDQPTQAPTPISFASANPLGHEPHPDVDIHTATFIGPNGASMTTYQAFCIHCHQWVPVGPDAPDYRCWHRKAA